MAFGGRVAEEIVFGSDKVTTGAGNDIERATALARRMVTQFGMSERIGPMAVGDNEQEIFLGREIAQRREVSEQTAQLVDTEVKRLIDEAYARATQILSENRELLDRIAAALLERETIDREDLDRLVKNLPLAPRNLPPDPAPAANPPGEQAGPDAGAGAASSERPRPNPPARECHAAGAPLAAGGARHAPLPRVGGRSRPGLGLGHLSPRIPSDRPGYRRPRGPGPLRRRTGSRGRDRR